MKVPVSYEHVNVSSSYCNAFHPDSQADGLKKGEIVEAKNIKNVIASSLALKNATTKAISEGYFPIVLGGDHS